MAKKILLAAWLFILTAAAFHAQAQSENDAFKFSQFNPMGTSRFMAMGGAFGSVGGDLGVIATNPAGLAFCQRRIEVSWGPGFVMTESNSWLFKKEIRDQRYRFNIPNGGMVYGFIDPEEGVTQGWTSLNLGVAMVRLNDYNELFSYGAPNYKNSMVDYWLGKANFDQGTYPSNLDPLGGRLFFDAMLIDTMPGDTAKYFGVIQNGGLYQKGSVLSMGAMDEFNLAIAANYNRRIALGLSIGVPIVHVRQLSEHSESDDRDTVYALESFVMKEDRSISGRGINVKIGAVLQAFDWLRFSGSFHMPTFFALTENAQATVNSHFDDGRGLEAISPMVSTNYQLVTPYRASLGAGFIFGKAGVIGIDWGMVDYSQIRLRGSDNSFDVNQNLQKNLGQVNNWRVGTEWKLARRYCLRGGVNFLDKKSAAGLQAERINYSFGFGIVESAENFDYSIDLGYRYGEYSGAYMPYGLGTSADPVVTSTFVKHAIFLTGTIKF
jgi:hypothetical protein